MVYQVYRTVDGVETETECDCQSALMAMAIASRLEFNSSSHEEFHIRAVDDESRD